MELPSRLFDMVQYFEQSMDFSRTELLALLNIGDTDFWAHYRDPDDLLGNILGPSIEEREEDHMSELVGRLDLSAESPPVHRQLKCAPEDVGRDQQLLDALHLLQREAIIPERLVEVSEERVRYRIEANQERARQNRDLDSLYERDYQ